MVQKFSLARTDPSPRLELPRAVCLAVLTPQTKSHKEINISTFPKERQVEVAAPPRQSSLQCVCPQGLFPSSFSAPFLPAHTHSFPDGSAVGWLKLTLPLLPLRHHLFFCRVRGLSPCTAPGGQAVSRDSQLGVISQEPLFVSAGAGPWDLPPLKPRFRKVNLTPTPVFRTLNFLLLPGRREN